MSGAVDGSMPRIVTSHIQKAICRPKRSCAEALAASKITSPDCVPFPVPQVLQIPFCSLLSTPSPPHAAEPTRPRRLRHFQSFVGLLKTSADCVRSVMDNNADPAATRVETPKRMFILLVFLRRVQVTEAGADLSAVDRFGNHAEDLCPPLEGGRRSSGGAAELCEVTKL